MRTKLLNRILTLCWAQECGDEALFTAIKNLTISELILDDSSAAIKLSSIRFYDPVFAGEYKDRAANLYRLIKEK